MGNKAIKIYRDGLAGRAELIAIAANMEYADIIASALAANGIGYWAEDSQGNRVLDD